MFKADVFNTLFAPDIYKTVIDSDIVALSDADVLKLYAKVSETDGVSAKAFAKDLTDDSDTEAESAAVVEYAKAKTSLNVAECPIPVEKSVVRGSVLLAVSTKLIDSEKALTKLTTLLKLSLTETDSVCVPKAKANAASSSKVAVSPSALAKLVIATDS